MIDDNHDEIRSLIAPYSLGALPQGEIRFVRAHILECEECMAEADSFFEASSLFSVLIDEVELPRGFADRVLDAARSVERATAGLRVPSRWRIAAIAAIGALTAATVMLGVIAFDARRVLQRNEKILSALVRGAGEELRGDQGEIGKLVTTEEGSLLLVSGLDAAPVGKSYELWFLDGEPEPVSAAVFDVADDLSVIETDLDFGGFSGAAVTLEPEGGSPGPGPTGDIVLQN